MTILLGLCSFVSIVTPFFFQDRGAWMTPQFFKEEWIKMVILFPIGFSCIWIWFKTGYTIENNILKIKYGPFKRDIKIDDIQSIRETKNPFTAPALSMDRIEINYAKFNTIEISPKNKIELVSQLKKQNSNIKTDNKLQNI